MKTYLHICSINFAVAQLYGKVRYMFAIGECDYDSHFSNIEIKFVGNCKLKITCIKVLASFQVSKYIRSRSSKFK
jgi:hypothetical protein